MIGVWVSSSSSPHCPCGGNPTSVCWCQSGSRTVAELLITESFAHAPPLIYCTLGDPSSAGDCYRAIKLQKAPVNFPYKWELILYFPDHSKTIRLRRDQAPTTSWCENTYYKYVDEVRSRYQPTELLTAPNVAWRSLGRILMGQKASIQTLNPRPAYD